MYTLAPLKENILVQDGFHTLLLKGGFISSIFGPIVGFLAVLQGICRRCYSLASAINMPRVVTEYRITFEYFLHFTQGTGKKKKKKLIRWGSVGQSRNYIGLFWLLNNKKVNTEEKKYKTFNYLKTCMSILDKLIDAF